MVLVGITAITSKKTGQKLMKLSLLDDSESPNRIGSDVSTDFVSYNGDYIALVGEEINIIYKKGFNGQAIVDRIEASK